MKKILLFILALFTLVCTSCGEETVTTTTQGPKINVRYSDVAVTPSPTLAGAIDILVTTVDNDAQIYYIVVNHKATNPTAAQIKAGVDYADVNVAGAGNGSKMVYTTVTGLEQTTKYDVYIVLEYMSTFSDIYSTSVITHNEEDVVDKGDGSELNPFRVYTVEDLQAVASTPETLSAHYSLQNDIDVSELYNDDTESFTPIGWQTGSQKGFAGSFSGNGFKIKNLYVRSKTESTGLFAQLAPTGIVRDLILENPDVESTGQRIAAVVGYCKGIILNCAVIGGTIKSVDTAQSKAGTIAGDLYEFGQIVGCYSKSTVEASGQNAGGIVGSCDAPTGSTEPLIVKDCYSFTTVNSTGKYAGGIVGYFRCGELSSCYYSGSVTGNEGVGGIAGMAQHRSGSPILPVVKNSVVVNTTITGLAASTTVSSGLVIGNCSTSNSGVTVSNLFYVNTTVDAVKTSTKDGAQSTAIANLANQDWITTYLGINFNAKRWCLEEGMERPVLVAFKEYDNGKWEA